MGGVLPDAGADDALAARCAGAGGGGGRLLAQGTGRLAEPGAEGAGEGRGAGEAGPEGHFGDGVSGVGQHPPGGLEAEVEGVGGGGGAEGRLEERLQASW